MMEKNLERLVKKLANDICNYPQTDKDMILELAEEIDKKTILGKKQIYKNLLIQKLGYTPKRYTVKSKIQTIVRVILYLTKLGVKDVGKIVTRFPSILGYNVKSYMESRVTWLKKQGMKDVGKVITRFPSIIALEIESYMQPRVNWLKEQGVKDVGKVITENRMKCGLGKCGRCNVGNVYICKEGSVFTAAQLKNLPAEY